MPLRWLFLDMNGFFASAEQHDDPRLRGRPVGIIPVESEHTGLIAVSVEAKAAGVSRGLSVREARRTCPEIRLLKARPDRYVRLHHALRASTDKQAPIHRVYSIDEWSVRLLREQREPAGAVALARRIKRQIRADFSPVLRCSIGLAPTRLLAKTACQLQKPDGLSVLTPDLLPDALEGLPLQAFPGIGPGIAGRLERHGVRDVRALWALSREQMRRVWGSVQGEHWWYGLHGVDLPEPATSRRSMGHAHVLPPEMRNDHDAFAVLVRLVCKLGARLREQRCRAGEMQVCVKYACGAVWLDSRTFPPAADTPALIGGLRRLWERRPRPPRSFEPGPGAPAWRHPKHVGVDVCGLVGEDGATPPLFPDEERPLRLSEVIDRINRSHGGHAVYFAAMHPVRSYLMEDKIAFGRIPETSIPM